MNPRVIYCTPGSRLPSNELAMTRELIADLLGVRRKGITETVGNLQRA